MQSSSAFEDVVEFCKLAVAASECQQDQSGHSPDLSWRQGLLPEKLALQYDACQFWLGSLIFRTNGKSRISTCGKLLLMRQISTVH
jgi:hypothetical protein